MKSKYVRYAGTALCVLSFFAQLTLAQNRKALSPAKQFELTVDSIMRGPRLVGYSPTGVYWSQDSQRVLFSLEAGRRAALERDESLRR